LDKWIIETFLSIKRMFDRECIYSVKLKNIIQHRG
jgi:hypothetical protein